MIGVPIIPGASQGQRESLHLFSGKGEDKKGGEAASEDWTRGQVDDSLTFGTEVAVGRKYS